VLATAAPFSQLSTVIQRGAFMTVERDEDLHVEEETGDEEAYVPYDITAYPSDLTLSGIHEMWHAGDLIVPDFQRNFVWTINQSSLLIESFLMGLPVPQMFVYVDESNRGLVIDGLQRMMSIVYYLDGYFGDETIHGKKQVFRLLGLSEKSPFFKKTFTDLEDAFQRKLKNSVLRTINIRQLNPQGEKTSIYHIFERLNTGGTPLTPQEIRNCVFRGDFVQELRRLNQDKNWRKLIGKTTYDRHQKDVELILRVFALANGISRYEKPMKEFLNKTMLANQLGKSKEVLAFLTLFPQICEIAVKNLPAKPFHLRGGRLNVSALDAVLATLINNAGRIPKDLAERYVKLKADKTFDQSTFFSTSDVAVVKDRFNLAKSYLIG
jgi:hypothetical protein